MKLPLPTTLRTRAAGSRQDARLKNAMVDKRKRIVKRPILDGAFAPVPLGPGLGLYVRDDTDIITITGNTLTTNPAPLTKKLSYSTQPVNASISTVISPSVTVQAVSLLGSVVTSYISTVSIALSANSTGASLVGTVTTNAVAGVATFNNLLLTRSGEGFKLMATAENLQSKISAAFNIPTRLTFTVQPDDTPLNTTLDPVEVTAKDTAGNTDTQYTGDITLATYSGGAGLDGTLTVTAVGGVASFVNLEFTTTGTFSLQANGSRVATAYPPAQESSNAFVISDATHVLTAIDLGGGDFGMLGASGSIAPTTLNGSAIENMFYQTIGGGTFLRVAGIHAQSFFTSMTSNSVTLTSASASYSSGGGSTDWQWIGGSGIWPSAGTYPVTFA